jgi:hypothetical protein
MPHAPRRTISGSGWETSITVVGSVPQSASAGGCQVEVVCRYSNRWAAAYTRSIRTMVIKSPSTSYSTR